MRITGRTAAQISASLEQQLRTHKRGAGEPLPTVRDLAATLGVSPATVAAAYKALRTRGLVAGRGRGGTRVSSTPLAPQPPPSPALPEGTFDLATGNPDLTFFPPLGAALRSIDDRAALYGETPEHVGLRAFAGTEFEADGVAAQSIAVVSGGMDGIERALREHLQPGDGVAIEDPSFPGLIDLVAASGYVAMPYGVDDEGPIPDGLADAITKGCRAIVLTPRAQNPTGAALSAGRAAELKRLLRGAAEILLIENDYAGPIAGATFHTIRGGGDSRSRWAVIRSTSKFLGPDLRVAVMTGDDLTIDRIRGRQALGARWVSHLLQRLALALWSDPSSGRRLARAAEIYAQRRGAVLTAMRDRGIEARGVSGFNIWVQVRDETRVVQALADRGWAVAAGERFRLRSAPGIRVTTSALLPADAGRLADDLAAVLRPPRRAFA
jgi:DNA-binding transcriptional MocR family regulator